MHFRSLKLHRIASSKEVNVLSGRTLSSRAYAKIAWRMRMHTLGYLLLFTSIRQHPRHLNFETRTSFPPPVANLYPTPPSNTTTTTTTTTRVLLGAPPERVERSPKYFIFQRYSRRCRLLCSNKMCRWLLRVLKANGLQPGSQSRVQLCLHRFAPRRLQTTALQSFRQESGPSRFRQTQRMSKRA